MHNRMTAQEINRVSSLLRQAAKDISHGCDEAIAIHDLKAVVHAAHTNGRLDAPETYLGILRQALATHWMIEHLAASSRPISMALELYALPDEQRRKGYRIELALL